MLIFKLTLGTNGVSKIEGKMSCTQVLYSSRYLFPQEIRDNDSGTIIHIGN